MKKKAKAASDKKLDKILKQQEKILKNETKIKKDESKIEKLEEKEIQLEKTEIAQEAEKNKQQSDELAKLEQIEKEVKAEVSPHPLTRITLRDLMKGMVGAFIGVVVHFTFIYGVEIGEHITTKRATLLLIFSFLVGGVFLYATGFRKIKDGFSWLLPYRLIVLYGTAVLVTVATLLFFYPHFALTPELAYKQIATVNLAAVIGACTADLIGRE